MKTIETVNEKKEIKDNDVELSITSCINPVYWVGTN